MSLQEELVAAYKTVKAAMDGFPAASPEERMMLLAAGFRTAWGVAWQRAKNAAPPADTKLSNGSTAGYSVMLGLPGAPSIASSPDPKLPELLGRSTERPSADAAAFLAVLLRTRALTDSQYKALCKELAIQYPARPSEQDVMSLGHDAVVRVLCGGRS